jgi:hypothetical protein
MMPGQHPIEQCLLQPNDPSWRVRLVEEINKLIESDFPALVQLLYRIDVNEQKLKQLLRDNPSTDAAQLIADMLVERQIQKQQLRQSFSSGIPDDGEEKW